jgi:mono/diheme cytochrome c family protein
MNNSRKTGLAVRLALGIAVLGCGAAGSVVQAQQAVANGNAVHGKQLYYAHGCHGCHGYNGETGARDLVATGSPFIASEALFIQFLRMRGEQAPLLPSTRMPNYATTALSDAQARDLYAFIRTFKLNAPRAEDVAALRAITDLAARPYRP